MDSMGYISFAKRQPVKSVQFEAGSFAAKIAGSPIFRQAKAVFFF